MGVHRNPRRFCFLFLIIKKILDLKETLYDSLSIALHEIKYSHYSFSRLMNRSERI